MIIEKKNSAQSKSNSLNNSETDELKEYKDFLDSGDITQEVFDAKKKQILGLYLHSVIVAAGKQTCGDFYAHLPFSKK